MFRERAQNPFQFCTQLTMVELTGLRARDLTELVNHLGTVSGSVIYHHTHHFLKQHQFLSPEPPNDFAYWVTEVLKEERLGERLAAIDTVRFSSIRALRDEIINVIGEYLSSGRKSRMVPDSDAFHFMKSRSYIIPTPFHASTLAELATAVERVSIHSLYHHIFEARLRLERGSNDISQWLETELGESMMAAAIRRMDPYTQTLERLRSRLLKLITERLQDPSGARHASG
jgi:hypothetical protein